MALSIAPGSSGPRWAVHRGTAFESDVLALKDSAGAALGLSDATLRLLIGRSLHAVPTFEALLGTGIVVLDEEGGEIAIRLSAQQTATFPAGVFCYELTVNSGSALVLQLNGGGIASRTLANNLGDAVVAGGPDGLAELVADGPELGDAIASTEQLFIFDQGRNPRRGRRGLTATLDEEVARRVAHILEYSAFLAGTFDVGVFE